MWRNNSTKDRDNDVIVSLHDSNKMQMTTVDQIYDDSGECHFAAHVEEHKRDMLVQEMVLGTWMPGRRPRTRNGEIDPGFAQTIYMGPQCLTFWKKEMIPTGKKQKEKEPRMMIFNSVLGFTSSDGQARW